MDETTEPPEWIEIPRDHPETPDEVVRRIEADEFWEKVRRWEHDDAEAEAERQREAAEWASLLVAVDVENLADEIEWRRMLRGNAEDMWRILHGLGCVVFVARGRLQIEPATIVPPTVLDECMSHPMREALEAICDERSEVGGDV